MPKKIAIIGAGNVGQALTRGFSRGGHPIKAAGHDPAEVKESAQWGEVIVLAVPFQALDEVVRELGGAADGKPVIDVTNALGPNLTLALGFDTSGAEELQKELPRAQVVKAFNTVFAQRMDTGRLGEERLSAFVAGDHPAAKKTVLELAKEIGFDPIDAGPLSNARVLEPMAVLNIHLGYTMKLGTDIGFKLLHR